MGDHLQVVIESLREPCFLLHIIEVAECSTGDACPGGKVPGAVSEGNAFHVQPHSHPGSACQFQRMPCQSESRYIRCTPDTIFLHQPRTVIIESLHKTLYPIQLSCRCHPQPVCREDYPGTQRLCKDQEITCLRS